MLVLQRRLRLVGRRTDESSAGLGVTAESTMITSDRRFRIDLKAMPGKASLDLHEDDRVVVENLPFESIEALPERFWQPVRAAISKFLAWLPEGILFTSLQAPIQPAPRSHPNRWAETSVGVISRPEGQAPRPPLLHTSNETDFSRP